jgi:hypothetical protein
MPSFSAGKSIGWVSEKRRIRGLATNMDDAAASTDIRAK